MESEDDLMGSSEKQHIPSQLHSENMAEYIAEASNQNLFAASHRASHQIVHGGAVIAENVDEVSYKESELSACYVTDELEEKQAHRKRRHGLCYATDESVERESEQICRHGVCEVKDEAGEKGKEFPTCLNTDEPEEKQGQQMGRRQGVCEAVDNTAACRRRARVLKKKLFGDDLPIHGELMMEGTAQRALNKRL